MDGNRKIELSLRDIETPQEIINIMVRRGNVKKVANTLGLSTPKIYAYGSEPDSAKRSELRVSEIVRLTKAFNDTLLIEWLSLQCDGVFVAIPQTSKPFSRLVEDMSEILQDTGKLMSDFAYSIEDGKIDKEEKESLLKKLDRLISHAVTARTQIELTKTEAQ